MCEERNDEMISCFTGPQLTPDTSLPITILSSQRMIDVGTGGGFPGLPLALCASDKEVVLLDSRGKKLEALKSSLFDELGVSNVETVHSRSEDYVGGESPAGFLLRAVAFSDR